MRRRAAWAFLFTATLFAARFGVCAAYSPSAVFAGRAMIDGRPVKYVIVKLDRVRIETALGQDHVGHLETLNRMALRHHAIAAIDGGFFEAYRRGLRKDLIDTTVIDGHIVFKGDVGSTLFFDDENRGTIEHIPLRIEGALDGSYLYPNNWYAYWINRLPENAEETVTIFTPAWGSQTRLDGLQIQVSDGIVQQISSHSLPIPQNGYVIYIRGEQEMASHFSVGRTVEYRIERANGTDLGLFADAREAIGGGPQLLANGHIFIDPWAEGFRDPKIYGFAARSMVGISRDQSELILATSRGTLLQMAGVMKQLGAYQAMNLDGGASSGLWEGGHYLTRPGRLLNNALLVLPMRLRSMREASADPH